MAVAAYRGSMPHETDAALQTLHTAVEHAQERLRDVSKRMAVLQRERARGREYAEIVSEEDRPLLVEMLSEVLDELAAAGATFRRAEARVLHAHGLSQEAIARLFGVTRQRVGVLLQSAKG